MVWNIDDPELYNREHFVVRHMYDAPHVAIVWFGFHPGQTLRDHDTSSVAIVQVLRGKIRLTTTTEQVLEAGQAVELKVHERHALEALDHALVQLILVPHPSYHSLADELDLHPTV